MFLIHILLAALAAPWHLILHHLAAVAVLGWVTALVMATSNTAKARSTETRVSQLVAQGIPRRQ